MDENTKAKLEDYLELFDEIKEKTQDERVAANLLTEIAKDRRMEQIRQERSFNGDMSATENQIAYLQRLGVVIPEGLTRQQASRLINNAKAARNWGQKPMTVPIRIP